MKPYADNPHRMAWQIVADLASLILIYFAVRLGLSVHDRIDSVAGVGVKIEDAGGNLSGYLTSIGNNLAAIPLIGSTIAEPVRNASTAAEGIRDFGVAIQEQVHGVADIAGIAVAAAPIVVILVAWLVPRLRFAFRAARVKKVAATAAGRDLLALRALASAPLVQLQRLSPDVAADWRHGNTAIVEALAALEMDRAGVRKAIEAGPATERTQVKVKSKPEPKQIPPHLG